MADLAEFAVEELLGYKALGAVYEEYGRQASPCPIYDFYNTGPVENMDTDTVEFMYLSRIRQAAPLNFRDQPARVMQPTGMGKRQMTMLRMFNSLHFGFGSLQMLMEPDSRILQRKGMTTIRTQIQDFATKDANTKRLFAAKALSDGIVYKNTAGQILESSSGSDGAPVDLGVPATNQGKIDQANFGGSGDIINVAWDQPTAKILTDLNQLTRAAEYANCPPPKHIWLQSSNRFWLRENTELLAFYNAGKERLDKDLRGDTFEVEGYTFHFSDSTYETSAGAVGYHIPATKAIVTPDPNDSRWLARAAGLEYVPTTLDIGNTVEELANSLAEVYGAFTYAVGGHNPVGINLFMGENWLFGFREPKAVWQLLVDF
jgi:hypothetical protein